MNKVKQLKMYIIYCTVLVFYGSVFASPVGGPHVNINRTNMYDRASPVFGTPEWDSGFDGDRAKSHVIVLASDSLGGRYSGFIGTDKADKYITDHFRSLGLIEPFGENGYYHNFTYGAGEYKMPSSLVVEYPNGQADSMFMWHDFNIYKYSGFGKVSGEVVFAGYGVSAPQKGWDDYADIDVMGKIVLVTRGLPAIDTIDWDREGSSGFKSTTALEKGAIGFMMTLGNPPKYATIQDEYFRKELPAVWISETLADEILSESGKTIKELRKEINDNHHSVSIELNAKVTMQVSGEYYPERPTRNICGILPGSDPELRNEVVIIGAHMDHHGTDAAGNIYPGADDNASGAAAMMELATVFSSKDHRPKRSIMFMGFAAEEEGLVGSRKFVESLPMEDYDVVAMLNMDMVGVGSGEIGIGGLDQFPPLEGMFTGEGNGAWQDSSLEKIAFWSLHGSSDHAAFMDAGIPSYVIGARGSHPNYHTPNDTVGAIQPDVLKAVGDMMYHCAFYLAEFVPDLKSCNNRTWHLLRKYPIPEVYRHGESRRLSAITPYFPRSIPGVPYAKRSSFYSLIENTGYDKVGRRYIIVDLSLGWNGMVGMPFRLPLVDGRKQPEIPNNLSGIVDPYFSYWGIPNLQKQYFVFSSPELIPSFSNTLQNYANVSVSFVNFYKKNSNSLAVISDLEIKELANVCRPAGVRPWLKHDSERDSIELLRVANNWGNQVIITQDLNSFNWDLLEKYAESGVFILFSKWFHNHSEIQLHKLIEAIEGDYGNSIGLAEYAELIEMLIELGVSEHDIKNLMVGNFERKMKIWEADSSFYQPEPWTNEERKIVKAISHRKWWLR